MRATLELSDRILRSAGFVRNTPPTGDPSDDVTIPSSARLEQLKHAVTFDGDVLPLTILGPLIQEQGSAPRTGDDGTGHPTLMRPILRNGDRYVVAIPLGLLDALRHEDVARPREDDVDLSAVRWRWP